MWLGAAGLSACLILGPYHMDEWGQISAFYLQKLGFMQASDMPWEFAERMRPWLQPLTYAALLSPVIDATGYHHFAMERVLHIVHWVLLVAIAPIYWGLLRASEGEGEAPALTFWLLGTLWFVPSMFVRHSSEVASALFLILMLWAWRKAEDRDQGSWGLLAGLAAGFAFWARFQSALFVAPFWLALLPARGRGKILSLFAAGVLLTMPIGVGLDFIGYGEWVFSPYEYFRANVLENRAAEFGESGPWFYFVVLAAIFLNPFIWVWGGEAARLRWREPWLRAVAVGCLGFVIAHTAIGHKEARFMFPILPLLGTLVVAYLAAPQVRWEWMRNRRFLRGVIAVQLVALVAYTALGLTKDRVRIDLALWNLPEDQAVISGANLYGPSLVDELVEPYAVELTSSRDYTRRFVRPPHLTLIGAYAEDYGRSCERHPEAVVLFTSVDATRTDQAFRATMLNHSWSTLASFPWPWFTVDAKWYRKMWRFKLVGCDAIRQSWAEVIRAAPVGEE